MKTRIHALAGIIGFLLIFCFWTSTVIVELFAEDYTVATVKRWILTGMFLLIPSMLIVGASGMSMGRHRRDTLAVVKKKRMQIIALNGLLVLLPAAWFLAGKASAGEFDNTFYVIQIVELLAGAANLSMISLNIRDGLTMTGRIRRTAPIRHEKPDTK